MTPADIRKRSTFLWNRMVIESHDAAMLDALADVAEAAKGFAPFREGSVLGKALARLAELKP